MSDLEKKLSQGSLSKEQVEAREKTPSHEEIVTEEENTLHRGLKARQVSTISLYTMRLGLGLTADRFR